MCRARVDNYVWSVMGADCTEGPLFGAYRISEPGPVQIFPLTDTISGSPDWVEPEARTDAVIEGALTEAGEEVAFTAELPAEDVVSTWAVDEGNSFPSRYEVEQANGVTTLVELRGVEDEPAVVIDRVPDWVIKAVAEQDRVAGENTDPEVND